MSLEEEKIHIHRKYKQSLDHLISKYGNVHENDSDIVDILYSEEEKTFIVDDISFIKCSRRKEQKLDSKVYLFSDVFKALCNDVDFDEIHQLLS